MQIPDKGDLVFLDFNPQSGHEQAGHRPAIILSPKNFNETTNFAVICPITRSIKDYPFEVKLPSESKITGVILTDQLKSLDWKSRGLKIVDRAPEDIVNRCIRNIQKFVFI